ncbi:MAG: hypothetical protein ACOCUV_03480, partial [bacterium]
MQGVHILWTGGFDSTFRLLWLIFVENEIVNPIYIIDLKRTTWKKEINTMSNISQEIRYSKDYHHKLKPLTIYNKDDFPIDSEIESLYNTVSSQVKIGTQYKWLSQFAKTQCYESNSIELCIHAHQAGYSELLNFIFKDIENDNFELKENDAKSLFSYFTFPLVKTSKKDMYDLAQEYGFINILFKTWFCHE